MLIRSRLIWVCALSLVTLASLSGCSKQARKERHLQRANSYFEKKEYQKSEVEYLNVLRLDPANVWAVRRLATIHYDHGNIVQALPFLRWALELEKDNADVRVKLGRIYLSAGQFQKAREEAIYILDRDPKNDDAILLLADGASTAKDVADSFQRLQKLQAQAGNRASWHLATAGLYYRQTNAPAGESAIQKALALEPQSSQVQVALANVYWQKRDFQKADQAFQKACELAPTNSPLRLLWVRFKFSAGFTNEAKELLGQITQQAPDYTPAWIYVARIRFDEQNYQECSNIVQRVLVQDGANSEARLLRARLKRVHGKPEDAIKDLEQTKQLYARSAEVAFQLALAHAHNQDRQKAISSLQEAVTLDPNSTQAILLLAELNLAKGDAASAVSSLENLLKKQPGVIRAHFLLASAYGAQRRFDDALALYKGLEKRFPTNPAVPYLTGVTLRQQNRNAEARKVFQRASELAPNDLLVSYQLVELDLVETNYQAAFQRVRSLLEKNPRSAAAKFLEARIFMAQTNLNEAEAALHKTIEWEPNVASAYGVLAQIYARSKRLPEAIKNLEQSLTRNPKNLSALMMIGSVYEQMGEVEKAVAKYKDALKIAPQFVPALNNLAYLLCEKLNNFDEAYEHAAKARELAPEDTHIADTLGWILYRRGEYGRALLLLQESAAKAPTQAEIQFHLGMTCYAMAQEEPARAALKRAIELAPNLPARDEALVRLSVLDMDASRADQSVAAKLQERIRKQPDDVLALLRLGKVYEQMGMTDKALQVTENARKLSPTSVPVLAQLAHLYSKSQTDSKQALALAREARKLAPNDPAIAHVVGRLAYQAGDHAWACSLLQESAAKQPGDPELLLDLAHAYYSIGRMEEADQTARRALKTGAAFAREKETQWLLALIGFYKNPNERVQAEAQVQQSLKAAPDYLPALMVAGLIHEQRERPVEAKQLYEGILSRYPLFVPAARQLAIRFAASAENDKKAYALAQQAREAYPRDPEVSKAFGILAHRNGEHQRAVQLLTETAGKKPEDPEVFYYLGMSHCSLKQQKEGETSLRRALELNLKSPQAGEAKRTLATFQVRPAK